MKVKAGLVGAAAVVSSLKTGMKPTRNISSSTRVSSVKLTTSSGKSINPVPFESADHWESWLIENHATEPDVWMKIAKVKSGIKSVTYAQALDVALCYGWIDSQRKSYDEEYFLQHFSPRRAKSPWSLVNIKKVKVLIAAGKMTASGQAAIDAAKADGRWYVHGDKDEDD